MKQSNTIKTKDGRLKNGRTGKGYGKASRINIPGCSPLDTFASEWFKATKVEPLPPGHPDSVTPKVIREGSGTETWDI